MEEALCVPAKSNARRPNKQHTFKGTIQPRNLP